MPVRLRFPDCSGRRDGREGKYSQERNPHDVLPEHAQDRRLAEPVLEQGEADVAGAVEDGGAGESDLETVRVEAVDGELEAEQDVVDDTDGDRARDTVVREHVRHHRELVVKRCARPQEPVNLVGDRALLPPLHNRVEQQLVTAFTPCHDERSYRALGETTMPTIGVLLPPVQLIVDGERHSLLEATLRVRRPADNVATHL